MQTNIIYCNNHSPLKAEIKEHDITYYVINHINFRISFSYGINQNIGEIITYLLTTSANNSPYVYLRHPSCRNKQSRQRRSASGVS